MDDLFMTQKNNVMIKNHLGQLEGYTYQPQHSIKIIKMAYMHKYGVPYEDIMIKYKDQILSVNQLVKEFLPNPIFEVLSIRIEFEKYSLQNNQIRSQLTKKNTQLEELKQKSEQEQTLFKERADQSNRKISDLEEKNKITQSELDKSAKLSSDLKGQVSILELASHNLYKQVDSQSQYIEQLQQQNEDLVNSEQQLQQQLEATNNIIKSQKLVISQMKSDQELRQTQNNQIRLNLSQTQTDLDRQKQKLKQAQEELQNQDHHFQNFNLETEINKIKSECRGLKLENQQLKESLEDQKTGFEKEKEKYSKKISNLIEEKTHLQRDLDAQIEASEVQNFTNLKAIKSSQDKSVKLEKELTQLKEQINVLKQEIEAQKVHQNSVIDAHYSELEKLKRELATQSSQMRDLQEEHEIQIKRYQKLSEDDQKKKSHIKVQLDLISQKEIALENEQIQSKQKDRTIELKEQEITTLVQRCNEYEANVNLLLKQAEQNSILYRKVLAKEIPTKFKLMTPIHAIYQDLTIFEKLDAVGEQQYEIIEIKLSEMMMNSFLKGNLADLDRAITMTSLNQNSLKRIVSPKECDFGRVYALKVIAGHDSIQNKLFMDSGFMDKTSAISCAYVNLISEQLYLNFTKLCQENGAPPLRYLFPKQYLIRAQDRYSYAVEVVVGKLFEYQGVPLRDDIDSQFNHAFSQYTCQATKGGFMVTNLKSVKPDLQEHTYYDPVLNSELGCFGKMDFGIQGIYKAKDQFRNNDPKFLYGRFEFLLKQ